MRQAFILLLYTICLYSCKSPVEKNNPVEYPQLPVGTNAKTSKTNLVVTTTADNKIIIDGKELSNSDIDSVLKKKIDSLRKHFQDTVTIVINADTASNYGLVVSILRSAKKIGAKVVANVQ